MDLEAVDDRILAELGASLLGEAKELSPSDVRRLATIGRHWLRENLDALVEIICSDPRVVGWRAASSSDPVELAALVADAFAGMRGWPPAASIARLVSRIGIDRFCS